MAGRSNRNTAPSQRVTFSLDERTLRRLDQIMACWRLDNKSAAVRKLVDEEWGYRLADDEVEAD